MGRKGRWRARPMQYVPAGLIVVRPFARACVGSCRPSRPCRVPRTATARARRSRGPIAASSPVRSGTGADGSRTRDACVVRCRKDRVNPPITRKTSQKRRVEVVHHLLHNLGKCEGQIARPGRTSSTTYMNRRAVRKLPHHGVFGTHASASTAPRVQRNRYAGGDPTQQSSTLTVSRRPITPARRRVL